MERAYNIFCVCVCISLANGNERNHRINVDVNIAILPGTVGCWLLGALNLKIILHIILFKPVLETWNRSYFSIRMSAIHKSHANTRNTRHRDENTFFPFHHKFNVETVEIPVIVQSVRAQFSHMRHATAAIETFGIIKQLFCSVEGAKCFLSNFFFFSFLFYFKNETFYNDEFRKLI